MSPDHFIKLVKRHADGLQPNNQAELCAIGACNSFSGSPVQQASLNASSITGKVSRDNSLRTV